MTFIIVLTFLISALIGWITIPSIIVISRRKRLFDTPNDRKVHTQAIPRLGGISFMPGVMIAFCSMLGVRYLTGFHINPTMEENFFVEFLFLSAGMFSLFFIGLADDLVGVTYKVKFMVQIIAAIFLVLGGVYMRSFDGFLGINELPDIIGMMVTIVIVVLIINAYNLIDGIDGLCSGLSLVALTVMAAWFWFNGIFVYAMLCLSLMGTLIVFFMYNVNGKRLKVFMGDGGSLMLGYLIAYLGLKFNDMNNIPVTYDTHNAPILVMSMIFVPLFDTIRVFIERISKGKSPFFADKTHVHHLFLRLGYTHLQSTGLILMLAIGFVIVNFALQKININILLLLDVLLGLIFLNFLPKWVIKNRVEVNMTEDEDGKRRRKRKNRKN